MGSIIRIFVVYLFLMICPVSAVGQSNPLLIVGSEFPPFEFADEQGKPTGINIDIISHIFNKLGIQFQIEFYNWNRAWLMSKEGQADAVLSTSRKEKRKPYLYYPEEDMWISEYVFFVKRDKKNSEESYSYLTAKNNSDEIGVISGYSYNDDFWNTFPNKDDGKLNDQLQATRSLELNFKKLERARINLLLSDKTVGAYQAKVMGLAESITYYELPLFSKGYPMPFTRNSKYPDIEKVAAAFEKELKVIKENGVYDEIINKWIK